MPKGLSNAQKNYAGPTFWFCIIHDPAAVGPPDFSDQRYFAEQKFSFMSADYLPYLRIDSPPSLSRNMAADSAQISLKNADLVVGSLMTGKDWEGLAIELYEYLVGLQSAVLHMSGILTGSQQTDDAVKFRVVSTLDAGQIDAQARIWSARCTLRFAAPQCGYGRNADGEMPAVELLGERTADGFDANDIGDSTLAMTPDQYKNNYVVITAGTGKGQKRRILLNDATNLNVINPFSTVPDGTSKFKVFTFGTDAFSAGAPKFLFTVTSSLLEAVADIVSTRTIGDSGLALPVNAHAGDLVAIMSGSLIVQTRKIVSNTATTITIDTSEKDFAPALTGGETFRVLFAKCPKDHGQSCEMRARAHRFNGFPTLNPSIGKFVPPLSGGDASASGDYNDTAF